MRPRRALLWLALALVAAGCASAADAQPRCRGGDGRALVLMAQAVPDAAFLPCVADLPEDWSLADVEIERGRARLEIGVGDVTAAATSRISVTLTPTCPPADGEERPSGVDGVRRVDAVADGSRGRTIATRTYRFDGGCVRERFDLASKERGAVLGRAWALLGLVDADDVSADVEEIYGRPLR